MKSSGLKKLSVRDGLQSAFTLLELLVTLALAGLVFAGVTVFFTDSSWRARDLAVRTAAWDEANAIANIITSELRQAGSGVPFYQVNFRSGGSGLGDAPLAVLPSSDADRLSFRLARRGVLTVLTTDFTPSNKAFFSVRSVVDFAGGDTIYLSNFTRGRQDGLAGVIRSISGLQIQLKVNPKVPKDAIFEAGSLAQVVDTVTYDGSDAAAGIVRSTSRGAISIARGATVSFAYIGKDGQRLALPLTDTVVGSSLAAVSVKIAVSPKQRLRFDRNYRARLEQVVTLRNLLIP